MSEAKYYAWHGAITYETVLRMSAEHCGHQHGAFTVSRCDVCGRLYITDSDYTKDDGFAVVFGGWCRDCDDVRRRTPEIYEWVLAVLANHNCVPTTAPRSNCCERGDYAAALLTEGEG